MNFLTKILIGILIVLCLLEVVLSFTLDHRITMTSIDDKPVVINDDFGPVIEHEQVKVSPPSEIGVCSNLDESDNVNGWQTYCNNTYGFTIQYPQSWSYIKEDQRSKSCWIGFDIGKNPGGPKWGILILDDYDLEESIADIGRQFADRTEVRKEIMLQDNIKGTLVTVTTKAPNIANWISKTVFFEKDGRLFSLSNGAIDDPEFTTFYESLKFLEP